MENKRSDKKYSSDEVFGDLKKKLEQKVITENAV